MQKFIGMRWIIRDGKQVLQYGTQYQYWKSGVVGDQIYCNGADEPEWHDVPLHEEAQS